MADEIDIANDYAQKMEERNVAAIRAAAANIPAGESGECYECGEESKRLVRGLCAQCRDKLERVVA